MVRVTVTENLNRHLTVGTLVVPAGTLNAVLSATFDQCPDLQPYVVDEQGELRQHIMLAVDQQLIQGSLGNWLDHTGFQRVHIMQALSGG